MYSQLMMHGQKNIKIFSDVRDPAIVTPLRTIYPCICRIH